MIAKFLRKINNLRYIMLFMQSTSVPCVGSIAAWNYYIRAHCAEVSYEVGSNNDKKSYAISSKYWPVSASCSQSGFCRTLCVSLNKTLGKIIFFFYKGTKQNIPNWHGNPLYFQWRRLNKIKELLCSLWTKHIVAIMLRQVIL